MPSKKKIEAAKPVVKTPAKPAPPVVPPKAATPPVEAPKPAPAKKVPAKKAPVAPSAPKRTLSPEERNQWLQDAAYFIAEKHGFAGDDAAYWAEAERKLAAELG